MQHKANSGNIISIENNRRGISEEMAA